MGGAPVLVCLCVCGCLHQSLPGTHRRRAGRGCWPPASWLDSAQRQGGTIIGMMRTAGGGHRDNVHLTGDFLLKFPTIGGMTFLIILIHLFS